MKISILLPYKENFTPNYAGAVSLFLNDTIKLSKYKKNIQVYGNTSFKKKLLPNYTNLNFSKIFFRSSSKSYVKKFLDIEKIKKSNLIEIHNRPDYISSIYEINNNIVLYFHNNPLEMKSSKTVMERIDIFNKTKKIIFNSNWTLNKFMKGLNKKYNTDKLEVINQSTSKKIINFKNKKKIILFVGRLNASKGYDLFGKAIVNVLNNNPDWKAIVIGDEPRENHIFENKNLKILGFQKYNVVTKWFVDSDISVVCSRWDEPFGRTALEASSAGCAVIITDKGGLSEASPKAMKIKSLTVKNIENSIEKLIKNESLKKSLQKRIYKHFYLTNDYISKKIDRYRDKLI
jgi:glycosyltransferase involved in cell wall biosynthesis